MSSRRKINRNIAKKWAIVGNSMRYKRAAVREASWNSLDDIKEEAFDGILITLSSHNSSKSLNVQKRVLRTGVGLGTASKQCSTAFSSIHKHGECK